MEEQDNLLKISMFSSDINARSCIEYMLGRLYPYSIEICLNLTRYMSRFFLLDAIRVILRVPSRAIPILMAIDFIVAIYIVLYKMMVISCQEDCAMIWCKTLLKL